VRWCSEGLEFVCWNGEVVRVAFAVDCHDREVTGWVATTAGISGEMIRDMMMRCVEQRHPSTAPGAVAIGQWLDLRRSSDDRNRRGAQSGGLLHPGRKPREQRHGRGLRQNLQARLRPCQPSRNAAEALSLIDTWMEDYNAIHPHSRLGYRSPREYIMLPSQSATCPV
jgi:transposase InsO family protein